IFAGGFQSFPTVIFDTGATLSGVNSFQFMNLETTGGAPLVSVTSGFQGFQFNGCFVTGAADAPFVQCSGGGQCSVSLIYGCDVGDGTTPVFVSGTGGTFQVSLLVSSSLEEGSFTSTGGAGSGRWCAGGGFHLAG